MGFAIYFLYQYACIVRNAFSQQMQIGNAMLGTVPAFYAVAFLMSIQTDAFLFSSHFTTMSCQRLSLMPRCLRLMEITYKPSAADTLSVGLNQRSFNISWIGLDDSAILTRTPTSPLRVAGKGWYCTKRTAIGRVLHLCAWHMLYFITARQIKRSILPRVFTIIVMSDFSVSHSAQTDIGIGWRNTSDTRCQQIVQIILGRSRIQWLWILGSVVLERQFL